MKEKSAAEKQKYLKDFEKYAREIASSPDKARKFLKDAGICTASGKLKRNYKPGC